MTKLSKNSLTKISSDKSYKIKKKFKKISIYKGPAFESVRFYLRKCKVMTLFSKDPITFRREQVI